MRNRIKVGEGVLQRADGIRAAAAPHAIHLREQRVAFLGAGLGPALLQQQRLMVEEHHLIVRARRKRTNGADDLALQRLQFVAHHAAADVAHEADVATLHARAEEIHAAGGFGGGGCRAGSGGGAVGGRCGVGVRLRLRGLLERLALHALIQLAVEAQRAVGLDLPACVAWKRRGGGHGTLRCGTVARGQVDGLREEVRGLRGRLLDAHGARWIEGGAQFGGHHQQRRRAPGAIHLHRSLRGSDREQAHVVAAGCEVGCACGAVHLSPETKQRGERCRGLHDGGRGGVVVLKRGGLRFGNGQRFGLRACGWIGRRIAARHAARSTLRGARA